MSTEKLYEYTGASGTRYLLTPMLNIYHANNNLSLRFAYYDAETAGWQPFCSATVNTISLAYLEGAIDINNNGSYMVKFLEDNGFGKCTPFAVRSGHCIYPVFRFDEERMRQIDPEVFAEYQRLYGLNKSSLASQISTSTPQSDPVSGGNPSKKKPEGR